MHVYVEVYCRYNERLNTRTEGSKTRYMNRVRKHIVTLDLVVSQSEVVGLVRLTINQRRIQDLSVCDREECGRCEKGVVCMCKRVGYGRGGCGIGRGSRLSYVVMYTKQKFQG